MPCKTLAFLRLGLYIVDKFNLQRSGLCLSGLVLNSSLTPLLHSDYHYMSCRPFRSSGCYPVPRLMIQLVYTLLWYHSLVFQVNIFSLVGKCRVLLHCGRDVSSQRRPAIGRRCGPWLIRCRVPLLLCLCFRCGSSSSSRLLLFLMCCRCGISCRLRLCQLGHAHPKPLHFALDDLLLPLQRTRPALQAPVLHLARIVDGIGLLQLRQRVAQAPEAGNLLPRSSGALGYSGRRVLVGGGAHAGQEGGVLDEALVALGGEEVIGHGGVGAKELGGKEGVDLAGDALVAEGAGGGFG